ncbi:membrane protein insertase YidC [Thalassobaculum fulvum]|uniref:Membrane protein insertase YidC n=1 Tax=Thalassobaculum fulvum TaxID=1633335 RepID=A0A919CRA2_9PROT|nr:membrane protein insertase YidC [Thalassobaculum fulvum]GHD56653.1 membrane protein insertase YidC [Thalassobaculum fulvum]
MTDQKNMILAIVLSVLILLGFQFFVERPKYEQQRAQQAQEQAQQQAGSESTVPTPGQQAAPGVPGGAGGAAAGVGRDAALALSPRVKVSTPSVQGSIALKGARIDDVVLSNYRVALDPASPPIHLLDPSGSAQPYYAEFGWVSAGGAAVALPSPESVWSASADTLTPDAPVTLTWDNGQGLTFERTVAVDKDYLFSVKQRVVNRTGEPVTLYPYGLISRGGTPATVDFYILHEGPLGVFDDTLTEFKYADLREDGDVKKTATGGWIGITDKYWLAALVPGQGKPWTYNFRYTDSNRTDRYQVDYLGEAMSVAAGGEAAVESLLFAGAKEVKLLDRYEEQHGIANFDLAIDFGWFYFLTKPFFYVLTWLHALLGNFGLAILGLTVIIKLLFFPLANKSYKSMAKMKELTPKLQEMREKYGDDRQRLNEEMMALYKREKVNPAAGCLPILIQIPVFFALYKTLFVSIEMRHAPFYGWIRDLSAPDPTSLFNLFGLIPWDPPQFLMIGAWPVLMGLTMFLQQKLNPQPTDPVQAKVFMFLPIMFTFLLGHFAAGLVIYWTWNNLLSIAQQAIIMRRMGIRRALS